MMPLTLRRGLMVIALAGASGFNHAGVADERSDKVDALFSEFATDKGPGCSVGVIQDGQYTLRRSYGMANLQYDVPLDSSSVFRIASVSKQFTAMSILLLAEQGKVDLDADVHSYLPDLMDYGHTVTIRQMLHHIAGMADYGDSPELFPNANGEEFRWGNEDYLSTDEFYNKVRQVPLKHAPGTKFLYSNFAYFLLGRVVESASGMSIRDFAARNIFQPLGMTHTQFNDDVNRVIQKEAVGYQKNSDGEFELYMTNLPYVGDGGIYTSIDDFLAWDQNYYHNTLGKGSQELINTMQTPGPLTRQTEDGGEIEYAMALQVSEKRGHKQISHSGSWVAFTTYYARIPDLKLSAVTFCNSAEAHGSTLGNQVMDIYLD
jgi:CubicO group peptidase (beta-lactamase class C family)